MGKFFKQFASFSFFTLISRIFGFLRDVIIANKVGAGAASDIFFVALKLPNFFRRIFAEGALSQSFVPIYNSELTSDLSNAQRFAATILYYLSLAILVLTIIVEIFTAQFILFFAPGFAADPDKFAELIQATRITFPYLFFISLVSFYSSLLYAHGKFIAGAIVPVIFNISLISGIVFFADNFISSTITLSYSLLAAGILQLIFILFFIKKRNLMVFPRKDSKTNKQTKEFFKRLLPAAFAASIVHLNVWIDMVFASYIPNSVSYLYYAERIVQLPLALIGTALAIVLLPKISKLLAEQKISETIITTERSILLALFFCIPASVALFILGEQIFQALFMHGEFTMKEVTSCANALKILALAMPAYVMIKVVLPHFHSRGDMKTPLLISIFGVLVNIVLNYVLVQKYSYIGIAMATVISAWFSYILFLIILRRRNYFNLNYKILKQGTQYILATIIMASSCYILIDYLGHEIANGGIFATFYLALIIITGLTIYCISCLTLQGPKTLSSHFKF